MIVILVGIVAEGLLTLQNDHRHTAGTRLPDSPDTLKSSFIRCAAVTDGASVRFRETECSCSTCSSGGTQKFNTPMIANHAKIMSDRKSMNRPRYQWPTVLQLMVAHEAFSMQDVKALTS